MATECQEFRNLEEIDYWVVPHQLVPFAARVMGMDWKLVVICMYVWETIEAVLFNCLRLSEGEFAVNSLISDPFQGFTGLIVAHVFGRRMVEESDPKAYALAVAMILPSTFMSADSLIWFYPPAFLVIFSLINHWFTKAFDFKFFLVCAYVVILGYLVFGLGGIFNSFYTAIIIGVCFAVIFYFFSEYVHLSGRPL